MSNLNFISKIIERVITKRLQQHLECNNINIPFQSAYKRGHSTETALLRVLNDVVCHLNTKNNVGLLLLDLSAAFDTIDHGILLERLSDYFGISGKALCWFGEYLSHRTMRVSINSSLSEPITLEYGVPQGSVLGPIFFPCILLPSLTLC